MIGRELADVYPKRAAKPGEVLLEVKNIQNEELLRDISFQLRAGEILGFAGITGSGRTELARIIFGADPATGGEMWLAGVSPHRLMPSSAVWRW
jgi:ABC-type sugar transport system ATPase subunit